MQVNISQAAEMVGITRATFYRHIEKKGITVSKDDDGNPSVDVSELTRVYGHRVKPLNSKQEEKGSNNTPLNTPVMHALDNSAEVKLLGEKIKHLEEIRDLDKSSSKKQIGNLESQIDYLQDSLSKSQENQSKLTLMLEHKENKENKDSGDWQKAMKGIEARIANQELQAKEEKGRAQKILRQNQALKKALDAEKNKSLWQKLFG